MASTAIYIVLAWPAVSILLAVAFVRGGPAGDA